MNLRSIFFEITALFLLAAGPGKAQVPCDRLPACNDAINVSLADHCSAPVTASLVMEDLDPECADSFYVKVVYPNSGHTIDKVNQCGEFKYEVYRIVGEADFIGDSILLDAPEPDRRHCWGYVNAEDKTPPLACVRKVVALWQNGVIYRPVTNEDRNCDIDGIADGNDKILDRSFLGHGTSRLLTCLDLDQIYNVNMSWQLPSYQYYTGSPDIYDNCSQPVKIKFISVSDELIDYGCDYQVLEPFTDRPLTQKVIRTFVIEDEKGNRTSVEQEICFFRPKLYLPNCSVELNSCIFRSYNPATFANLGTKPYFINALGARVNLTGHQCNFTVGFEDIAGQGEGACGFKVIRTWKILDWCWDPLTSGQFDLVGLDPGIQPPDACGNISFANWQGKSLEWEQVLEVYDHIAPVVNCPFGEGEDQWILPANPFDCKAAFAVPSPKVTESCEYNWDVEVWTEAPELWHGVHTGNYQVVRYPDARIERFRDERGQLTDSLFLSNIPYGRHFLRYLVRDLCGNEGQSGLCPFYVTDLQEPVAVCREELTVSLVRNNVPGVPGAGYARIFAQDIDGGSSDACSPINLQARRFLPLACVDLFRSVSNQELAPDTVILDKPGTDAHGQSGLWTVWSDYVDFTCCDLAGRVLLELGVWDRRPAYPDTLLNDEPNFSYCWSEVRVEDKAGPVCLAPHDLYLDCRDIPPGLPLPASKAEWSELPHAERQAISSWFGALEQAADDVSEANDNCSASVQMIDVRFNLHCGAGFIERFFEATDVNGLRSETCTQKIYLYRHHDYCIAFPADTEADCPEDPEIPGVELFESGCDLLAVSVHDEKLEVPDSEGGCYKVFRTYRVLNWCQFDEDIDPGTPLFDRFDSTFDREPLVVGRDEDDDGIPGDEPVYVRFVGWERDVDYQNELQRIYNDYGLTITLVSDEEGTFGHTYIDDNCDPFDYQHYDPAEGHHRYVHFTRGFYQYTQVVKVVDQVPPVLVDAGGNSFTAGPDCAADVLIELEVLEECTAGFFEVDEVNWIPDAKLLMPSVSLYAKGVTARGRERGFTMQDVMGSNVQLQGTFPLGEHLLEVKVSDGCGNRNAMDVPFQVLDETIVPPICHSSLVVELMEVDNDRDGIPDRDEGEMTIWANDFVASAPADCSEPVSYSIHRTNDVEAGLEVPTPDSTSLTVTCFDPIVMQVDIYSWDQAGNSERCRSVLFIDDIRELCRQPSIAGIAEISGRVLDPDGGPVPLVEVELSGPESVVETSSTDGHFQFFNLDPGYDYTLTPSKEDNYLDGVSTYDLLLMSRHVLGVNPLQSFHELVAADVNRSGSVTALDLVQVRKLILGIDSYFANSPSWRFIAAQANLEALVEPLPEVINFNDLEPGLTTGDFTGIKIGDVSGDAGKEAILPRDQSAVKIVVKDMELLPGKVYRIPLSLPEITSLSGLQFTLRAETGLQVQQVEPGLAGPANLGLHRLDEGLLTVSWHEEDARVTDAGSPLLFLLVTAKKRALLSQQLLLDSRPTNSLAYRAEGIPNGLQLAFELGGEGPAVLEQNVPNPFRDRTVIPFVLKEAGQATIRISDINGRVLKVVRRHFAEGPNRVTFLGKDLAPTGVLLYSLIVDDEVLTRKMILRR